LVHSQVTFLHSVGLVFSIRDDEREKKMWYHYDFQVVNKIEIPAWPVNLVVSSFQCSW
jgi:hypothetical protein